MAECPFDGMTLTEAAKAVRVELLRQSRAPGSLGLEGAVTLGGDRSPPPFDPDPELIDDLEGNPRTRRSYQNAARALRDAESAVMD